MTAHEIELAAQHAIDVFHEMYPEIADWKLDELKRLVLHKNKYVTNEMDSMAQDVK